jgi:hypothetical protein
MGVAFVRQTLLKETLTGVGPTEDCARVKGLFNFEVSGDFEATLYLERSLDNEQTWQRLTAFGVDNPITGPVSEQADEPEVGACYRFNCVNYTSGPIHVRISK